MLLEEKLSDKGVLYVKYEDLRDESRRVDTLRRIMTFTGFPDVSDERINCAFSLANSRHVKVCSKMMAAIAYPFSLLRVCV